MLCTEKHESVQICEDVISEFMASSKRGDKLLEIKLRCGAELPPRIKISGIHAEKASKREKSSGGGHATQVSENNSFLSTLII